MFKRKPDAEAIELNKQITRVHSYLDLYDPSSEEYAKVVTQLVKLYAQKETIPSKRISPDTLATISANLLGIIVIVGHERANVITSKAIGFVTKASR